MLLRASYIPRRDYSNPFRDCQRDNLHLSSIALLEITGDVIALSCAISMAMPYPVRCGIRSGFDVLLTYSSRLLAVRVH
jgi:hypothetical protein